MPDYVEICPVSTREVVEHLLWLEASKQQSTLDLAELRALSDSGFFQAVRALAARRSDTNPVLVWTIGAGGNQHFKRVRRWFLANVAVEAAYVAAINDTVKADLESVGGNLRRFANKASK